MLGELLGDYTVRTVLLGAVLIGLSSGVLGSFALLRRQSLLGDAVAHCALPGVAAAFLLTGTKHLLVLLIGAGISGWLGALAVSGIQRRTRLSYDAALGMMLSVFFGAGLVLITLIQKQPNAAQSGLDTFLFGQAATLLARDVAVIAVLGAAALAVAMLSWKEWKLVAFDPEFAAALGWRVRALELSLLTALVVAVVIGLQAVGVVLMSAMVVAPGAAARQWTDRLGPMVLLAAGFGVVAGSSGVLVSSAVPRMPTGPIIVLIAAGLVVASLVFGASRGLVWSWWRRRNYRRGVRIEHLLDAMVELAAQHADPYDVHEVQLIPRLSMGAVEREDLLQRLAAKGWIARPTRDRWALTPAGLEIGRAARADRLAREADEAPAEAGP